MIAKAIALWSGGKDSVLALYETTKQDSYRVEALLTTVTRDYDRISIHGTPHTARKASGSVRFTTQRDVHSKRRF